MSSHVTQDSCYYSAKMLSGTGSTEYPQNRVFVMRRGASRSAGEIGQGGRLHILKSPLLLAASQLDGNSPRDAPRETRR
jgi:hypothetical protein